jgi:hypothetical protein
LCQLVPIGAVGANWCQLVQLVQIGANSPHADLLFIVFKLNTKLYTNKTKFRTAWTVSGGRDSSVGIATCYGMDDPGIESRWRRDFPHPSRPALVPTHSPIQCVPDLGRRQSGQGVSLITRPYLAPRLKK